MTSASLFVAIDPDAVYADVFTIFMNQPAGSFDLSELAEAENENSAAHGFGITGQDHLQKALVMIHVYQLLKGYNWVNIEDVTKEGALVEFKSPADAMLFKLGS